MQSFLQILKVNELRTGAKEGRAWAMQDCECILLNEDGHPDSVGVLMLPKDMQGEKAPKPGVYTGAFALKPDLMTKRIEARLVTLQPIPADYFKRKPA
jgi:hypothetical protein